MAPKAVKPKVAALEEDYSDSYSAGTGVSEILEDAVQVINAALRSGQKVVFETPVYDAVGFWNVLDAGNKGALPSPVLFDGLEELETDLTDEDLDVVISSVLGGNDNDIVYKDNFLRVLAAGAPAGSGQASKQPPKQSSPSSKEAISSTQKAVASVGHTNPKGQLAKSSAEAKAKAPQVQVVKLEDEPKQKATASVVQADPKAQVAKSSAEAKHEVPLSQAVKPEAEPKAQAAKSPAAKAKAHADESSAQAEEAPSKAQIVAGPKLQAGEAVAEEGGSQRGQKQLIDEGKLKELHRKSVQMGLTLAEVRTLRPEELQQLFEGEGSIPDTPASTLGSPSKTSLPSPSLTQIGVGATTRSDTSHDASQDSLARLRLEPETRGKVEGQRIEKERREMDIRAREFQELSSPERKLQAKLAAERRLAEIEERKRYRAATKIQAFVRGRREQRAFEMQKVIAFETRRRQKAARQQERALAKKRIETIETNRKGKAATIIQTRYRGKLARERVDRLRKQKAALRNKEEMEKRVAMFEEAARRKAVVKIQRLRRQQLARRSVMAEIERLREERKARRKHAVLAKHKEREFLIKRLKEMEERRKNNAATVIVKYWKSYVVRSYVWKVRKAKLDRDQKKKDDQARRRRDEIVEKKRRQRADQVRQRELARQVAQAFELKQRDLAARKIQAARRGQLARRLVIFKRQLEAKRKLAERNEEEQAWRMAEEAQRKKELQRKNEEAARLAKANIEAFEKMWQARVLKRVQGMAQSFVMRWRLRKLRSKDKIQQQAILRAAQERRKKEAAAKQREETIVEIERTRQRLKAMEARRRDEAARKIQAYLRAKLARAKFKVLILKKREADQEKRNQRRKAIEEIRRIQADQQRLEKALSRRKDKEIIKQKLREFYDRRRYNAATKVQSLRRAHLARRRVAKLLAEKRKRDDILNRDKEWRKQRERQKKEEDAYFQRIRDAEKLKATRRREAELAKHCIKKFEEQRRTRAALMIQASRRLQLLRRALDQETRRVRFKIREERREKRQMMKKEVERVERRLKAMTEKKRVKAAMVIQAWFRSRRQRQALILDKQQRLLVGKYQRGNKYREKFGGVQGASAEDAPAYLAITEPVYTSQAPTTMTRSAKKIAAVSLISPRNP
eukprot:TRINITY_DN1939_c1_g1_i1.p1 TRINITY_DN1939_c1_g1~~TRINITY_DN1939_c1_g1_i1.p1  ORF type:complete len:1140 (-),score=304.36 TRINITY_DN1939_c1_g1_i1:348-3767(-)